MPFQRRIFLKGAAAVAAANIAGITTQTAIAEPPVQPKTRPIPSSGEQLPIVGLGSWITFNVGNDPQLLDASTEVIATFLQNGGRIIDSSPMYGSSQATIGYALNKLGYPKQAFAADKIWTSYKNEGPSQFDETHRLWGVKNMDLMQVHNLLAWRDHLAMLQEKKAAGEIRYVGITTSHGRRHSDLEAIMKNEKIDFVQLTYNVADREAEERLLPLALDRGIAIIVNRPYQRGSLISRVSGKPLPDFANEFGASSWPQYLLKFVISHPGVTCAIPATTRVDHVIENLTSAAGRLPDMAMRKRMIDYLEHV